MADRRNIKSVPLKRRLKAVKTAPSNSKTARKPDLEINGFFLDCCPMTQHGYDYLNGYRISDELIMCMRLGFLEDPEHVFDLLDKAFGADRLKSAGYLDDEDRFVFSNHQLVFPYLVDGQPTFFRARTIRDYVPREVTLALHSNHWIYNGDVLRYLQPGATVYVTQGPLETLEVLEVRLTLESVQSFGVIGVQHFNPRSYGQLKPYRVVTC
jgi:hypothetical protein